MVGHVSFAVAFRLFHVTVIFAFASCVSFAFQDDYAFSLFVLFLQIQILWNAGSLEVPNQLMTSLGFVL